MSISPSSDVVIEYGVIEEVSRSDHRVVLESCRGFKPIIRVGFYRLPRRRMVRCQRNLEGREDPRGL